MKVSIRRNVFETNSSSSHVLAMCTEEEFERIQNKELGIITHYSDHGDELCEIVELPNEDAETFWQFANEAKRCGCYFEGHYDGIVAFGHHW